MSFCACLCVSSNISQHTIQFLWPQLSILWRTRAQGQRSQSADFLKDNAKIQPSLNSVTLWRMEQQLPVHANHFQSLPTREEELVSENTRWRRHAECWLWYPQICDVFGIWVNRNLLSVLTKNLHACIWILKRGEIIILASLCVLCDPFRWITWFSPCLSRNASWFNSWGFLKETKSRFSEEHSHHFRSFFLTCLKLTLLGLFATTVI